MARTKTEGTKKSSKNKKEDKGMALESILFNCRDYLRGSAALNDKRDIIPYSCFSPLYRRKI